MPHLKKKEKEKRKKKKEEGNHASLPTHWNGLILGQPNNLVGLI